MADKVQTEELQVEDEYFTVDEILGYDDMDLQDVVIKAWGGKKIQLRPLTMAEAKQFTRLIEAKSKDETPFLKAAFQATCVRPEFSAAQVEAIWANKSAAAVAEIIKVIRDLNGIGQSKEEGEAQRKRDEDEFQD